jgi:hypothetical protein
MATNLFTAFDDAFAPPVRWKPQKLAMDVVSWLMTRAERRLVARRPAQLWYAMRELPRRVRKDIGYLPCAD